MLAFTSFGDTFKKKCSDGSEMSIVDCAFSVNTANPSGSRISLSRSSKCSDVGVLSESTKNAASPTGNNFEAEGEFIHQPVTSSTTFRSL